MAQEAHDQAGLDAELAPGVDDRAMEALDHRRECDAAGRVALRIEEHLDMPDIVGVRAFEIGPGEVVEVLLGDQHRHAAIVEVEKILQVAKPVGLAQRLDRRIRQRMPLRRASANIISGSRLPSMWMCSSHLGSRLIRVSVSCIGFFSRA